MINMLNHHWEELCDKVGADFDYSSEAQNLVSIIEKLNQRIETLEEAVQDYESRISALETVG